MGEGQMPQSTPADSLREVYTRAYNAAERSSSSSPPPATAASERTPYSAAVEPPAAFAGPLPTDAALLDHVFSFAGKQEYLWIASVSQGWRTACASRGSDGVRWTSYTSAVASVERLRFAFGEGERGESGGSSGACTSSLSVEKLVRAAAAAGSVAVLEQLRLDGRIRPPARVIVHEAAGAGHVAVLGWARRHGYAWSIDPAAWASKHGRLAALVFLQASGCPWSAYSAAAAGHLPPMEFLRRAGCPMEVRAALAAAGAKRGAALRYLLRSGCPVDATVFARCVAWGERPVISMLLDAGCSCDADAAAAAAGRNDLSLLMYLVNTAGAPMDERVCSESMGHPDGAVLRLWAHANGLACKGCACRQPLSSSSLYPWKHGASSKVPRNKQQPLVAVRS